MCQSERERETEAEKHCESEAFKVVLITQQSDQATIQPTDQPVVVFLVDFVYVQVYTRACLHPLCKLVVLPQSRAAGMR